MEHRVSTSQLHELLEHLSAHSVLVKGVGLGARSKEGIDREWQKLADKLNSHGSGSSKTATRWKRYWADVKHKAKARAAARRRSHNLTGGGPSREPPLSDVEQKVLDIIGEEAIYGDLPNTVPLLVDPDPPVIVIETEETEYNIPPAAASAALPYTQDLLITPPPMFHVGQNQTYTSEDNNITIGSPTPRPGKIRMTKGKENAQRKPLDTSLIVELEHRRVKAEEKLADAALIMAEAAKGQSDAAKLQANATLLMAESFKNLTNLLDQLVKKQ